MWLAPHTDIPSAYFSYTYRIEFLWPLSWLLSIAPLLRSESEQKSHDYGCLDLDRTIHGFAGKIGTDGATINCRFLAFRVHWLSPPLQKVLVIEQLVEKQTINCSVLLLNWSPIDESRSFEPQLSSLCLSGLLKNAISSSFQGVEGN